MKVRVLLAQAAAKLTEAGVPDPDTDARYLYRFASGLSNAELFAHMADEAKKDVTEKFLAFVEQRAGRVPLQHILGSWEFMGREFYTSPKALIPRSETELLVEMVASFLPSFFSSCEMGEALTAGKTDGKTVRLLDIGTGTGCIPLSLLTLTKEGRLYAEGVDLSEEALSLAEENRERFGFSKDEMVFFKSDLFSEVTGQYDVIVSNPPYIPERVIPELEPEVRDHDPKMALVGGEDGLFFYRKIVEEARVYLREGGMLFFEIGYDEAQTVTAMMEKDFCEITIKKDLAGLDRIAYGRKK